MQGPPVSALPLPGEELPTSGGWSRRVGWDRGGGWDWGEGLDKGGGWDWGEGLDKGGGWDWGGGCDGPGLCLEMGVHLGIAFFCFDLY